MSEFLAAAAQAMSVPETLVQRSAEARAKASGSDVESVLSAWAGGTAVTAAVATPAPAAEAPAPESTAPATESAAPEPVPAAPAAQETVAAVASAPAVAVIEEPEEAVVAAPLSARTRLGARVGAVTGGVLALAGWVFSSQYLIGRAGVTGEAEELQTVVGVDPGSLVLAAMLISVAIGALVAGVTRLIPAWRGRGMRLRGSPLPSIAIGVLVGGLVGALAGAIISGLGTAPELPDDPTQIPLLPAIVWGLVVWLAGGWLIGVLVQAAGTPDGIDPTEAVEISAVRGRLAAAFSLPLLALVAITVLVLAFAFVFLSFPSYSPLTGTVIAGSILGFAALSASRPNMKVGLNELLVAAAGIGVAVVLIYAVLQTTGAGGHGEEEGEHAETTESTHAEGETAIGFRL